MKLTPAKAVCHIPRHVPRHVPRSVRESVRGSGIPATTLHAVVAALLLAGPGAGVAGAGSAGNSMAGGTVPWYAPAAATLLAAVLTATVTWLTARWNRAQQRRDRTTDQVRAELHEQRVASWTVWGPYLHRVEDILLAVGALQREAHRRRLHHDDAAAADLLRQRHAAERHAEHGPGAIPDSMRRLAEALADVERHLLPGAAELDRVASRSGLSAACMPLLAEAGEQARAVDRLARTLQDAYSVLEHEWGIG